MNTKNLNFHCLLILAIAFIATGCGSQKVRIYEANVPQYISASEWRASNITLSDPRELGTAGKIYIKDQYLFVNEYLKGIHIFDNTDPSNPTSIGFLEILANVDMAVRGTNLYVDSYYDLLVFDISNPANPVLTSRVNDVFNFYAFSSLGEYDNNYPMAYVDPSEGIVVGWKVEKVTEESQISNNNWLIDEGVLFADASTGSGGSTGNLQGPGQGGSKARFTVHEDHLYTLESSELGVFNISSDPVHTRDITLSWFAETLFPRGNQLFIGTQNGMLIYDVSTPSNPTFISQYEHVTACDPVVVQGNLAYVTLATGRSCWGDVNELQVIDITNPVIPVLTKRYAMHNPQGLGVDGDLLFICDGAFGLKVYDKSDINNISGNLIKRFADITADDVIPYFGTLIMTSKEGIFQYDYTDPADIRQLSLIPANN